MLRYCLLPDKPSDSEFLFCDIRMLLIPVNHQNKIFYLTMILKYRANYICFWYLN